MTLQITWLGEKSRVACSAYSTQETLLKQLVVELSLTPQVKAILGESSLLTRVALHDHNGDMVVEAYGKTGLDNDCFFDGELVINAAAEGAGGTTYNPGQAGLSRKLSPDNYGILGTATAYVVIELARTMRAVEMIVNSLGVYALHSRLNGEPGCTLYGYFKVEDVA